MGSHIVAKEKIEKLTTRLEKSLYQLKYGDKDKTIMSDELYSKIECICKDAEIEFPLKRVCGEIRINCGANKVFCSLSKLADDYDIVLDCKLAI